MNGLQRYLAALKGQRPDFLPRIPILMQYAAEYIGSDYAAFASDYRVLVESNIRCAKAFGIDQLSCISDPYRETQGFGSEIEYVTDGVPRSTHPLESDRDMSRLLTPDPFTSERMSDRLSAAASYKEQYGKDYSIMGWVEGPAAEAADLRDVVNFLMDLVDDENYAADLMDLCLETGIRFACAQVAAGTDTIGIGDAIASQVSPSIYEELIQPREKKLVNAVRSAGAYVRLHICGDISHLLPGIADLGVDILDVDHMVDLMDVRNAVGPDVVIAGNMDPAAGVRRGTPEFIRGRTEEIYRIVGNRHMINAGCEIPPGTPAENLRALCEPLAWHG
jgi:MtaA/CmuA family methyltransferase